MDLTSLYSACKSGDLKKLKRVCDTIKTEYANLDFLHTPDHQGYLPLDITVLNDKFECCQYLFESFNLNPININGVGQSAFFYSIDLARHAFLKYFIDNSKKYLPTRTQEDLLTQIDVNNDRKCAFQIAIESSHPAIENMLHLLLEYMRFTFQLKKKIFIGAVRTGNTTVIDFILDKCIQEDERSELLNLHFNLTSNYMRKTNLLSEAVTTPLIHAINRRDPQLVNFFISEPLIDVNQSNAPLNDQTPLFAAIKLNDLETVLLLFEKSVSNLLSVKGVTPLKSAVNLRKKHLDNHEDHRAAKQNFMIIELLCTTANDPHLQDEDGTCSFDTAVINEYTDVIEHFVSVNGDLFNRKNKIGKAPIEYASEEYAAFLEQSIPRRISRKNSMAEMLNNNRRNSIADQRSRKNSVVDIDVVRRNSVFEQNANRRSSVSGFESQGARKNSVADFERN